MASPTQWTWVWVNSGSWWWTGRPGVLQSRGSQRVGRDWVTEQQRNLVIKLHVKMEILHADPIPSFGLFFNEWCVFLLHLSHWLSNACSQSSPPSIPNQYSVFLLCARPPVFCWLYCFHFVPLWREKFETRCILFSILLFLYFVSVLFSLSVENLPSCPIKCNTIYKVKPNPAYSHTVIPVWIFLLSFSWWQGILAELVLRLINTICVQFDRPYLSGSYPRGPFCFVLFYFFVLCVGKASLAVRESFGDVISLLREMLLFVKKWSVRIG